MKWDYKRTFRIAVFLLKWDYERFFRVLMVKPVKIFQNFYYTTIVLCGIEKRSFKYKSDKIEHIGGIDENRKVHLHENKKHYKKLFDKSDLYVGDDYKIYRDGKIGLATDGDEILIFKKIESVSRYFEYMSELKCLEALKNCNYVPKVRCVDYENKIIYMQYIDGLVLLNNVNTIKEDKMANKVIDRLECAIKSIHKNKVFIYDLRDRNIIIKSNKVYLIDFGYSMKCDLLPAFYFEYLKNLDFYNFKKKNKKYAGVITD